MKILLSSFLMVTLFACHSPEKASEASTEKADPQLAVDFMNSYVQSVNERKDSKKWIAESKQLSKEFKTAYQKMVQEAWEADPELGLDFDPIFDAQDYSEKGYRIQSFDSKTGIVNLESVDGLGYHAKARVKLIEHETLVDGAGVIRMVEK